MNFHQIYVIHTIVTSSFTFIANFVLIFLIFTKTPTRMKSYSNVILQTCVIDIFMAFISCFTLFEIDTSYDRLYLRSAAPWIPTTGCYPCIAFWLFFTATYYVHWCMFIQALFRYYQIVRSHTLSGTKTWIIQFFVFLASGILNSSMFSFCSAEGSSKNYALSVISPWDEEKSLDAFRSQAIQGRYIAYYIIGVLVITTFCYAVYAICMYLVLDKMKKSTAMFSAQTLKMNKELNNRSIYQMIIPCLAFIIGWLNCGGVYYDVIENISLLLIGFMIMQYIQVFNPIITIITIQCYRRAFFKKKPTPVPSMISSTMITKKALQNWFLMFGFKN